MAIFNDTHRKGRMTIDDAMRSTDGALNVLIVLLLIALIFGSWYFYGRMITTVDNTNTGASTITTPVITPPLPSASPTQPAPSPNPAP
jgi:hypothetical protein